METKNVYRTIAEIIAVLSLIIVGNVALDKETAYKCDARGIAMNCDSLSKYYSMSNGKCINAELGNKVCRSGWDKLSDSIMEEQPTNVPENIEVFANNENYSCDVVSGKVNSYSHCISSTEQFAYLGELI